MQDVVQQEPSDQYGQEETREHHKSSQHVDKALGAGIFQLPCWWFMGMEEKIPISSTKKILMVPIEPPLPPSTNHR